jgi:hypothetical protein
MKRIPSKFPGKPCEGSRWQIHGTLKTLTPARKVTFARLLLPGFFEGIRFDCSILQNLFSSQNLSRMAIPPSF